MSDEFKYEVAFSFLQDDEQLALEIADRIRDRVSTSVFVYSERQNELAGTDGVEKFSRIFGEESRIVVVLYREGWGQTRWTRVEETAIRTRGFNEGHEFALLVKLDQSKSPIWLPPTRIYLGYERYGIDGVASVIEARVHERGGTVHAESASDYAARISRDLSFEDYRSQFLRSDAAVEVARREVDVLFTELKRLADGVNHASTIQIGFDRPGFDFCGLSTDRVRFGVTWHQQWANSLEYAGLSFILTDGGVFYGPHVMRQPDYKQELSYSVDLDRSRSIGWRESKGEKRLLSSFRLAELWVKLLLEREHRRAERPS